MFSLQMSKTINRTYFLGKHTNRPIHPCALSKSTPARDSGHVLEVSLNDKRRDLNMDPPYSNQVLNHSANI